MHLAKLSVVSGLVAGLLLADAGCGTTTPGSATGRATATTGLRSQRRLAYRLSGPVSVAESPGTTLTVDLDRALRKDVRRDMRELGLEVDGDPALDHDLTVFLSASVQSVSRLARGRASLWVVADGQLLEQIESAEVIEAPDRLAAALSRDLVERLARSPRPAEYADALYGRRLRPLRDSVGRHAAGRGDETAGMPPLEMLNYSSATRLRQRSTTYGRAELAPPPAAPEPARAAAQAAMQNGQALLAAGQAREAYGAFEQAYLADGSAEPLFGMAESLLRAGGKQQALIFYRAYLRRAPPNSPEAAKANAQLSALEPAPRTP